MSMRLWYDVIEASYHGENRHPQVVIKELGLKQIKAEPFMIVDGWRFEVEDNDVELPPWITISNGKFTGE